MYKTFLYRGIEFRPIRAFNEDEQLMGNHLPKQWTDISNHPGVEKTVYYDRKEFLALAKSVGAENIDVFERVESGRLMIPYSRDLFFYNPNKIYEDSFYNDILNKLKKESEAEKVV